VNGASRRGIARLNAGGTIDSSFGDGQSGAGPTVFSVAPQADGKAMIGGFFARVNGVTRINIARLNADGSLDMEFGNGLSGVFGDSAKRW
jgi:hypothetical protein